MDILTANPTNSHYEFIYDPNILWSLIMLKRPQYVNGLSNNVKYMWVDPHIKNEKQQIIEVKNNIVADTKIYYIETYTCLEDVIAEIKLQENIKYKIILICSHCKMMQQINNSLFMSDIYKIIYFNARKQLNTSNNHLEKQKVRENIIYANDYQALLKFLLQQKYVLPNFIFLNDDKKSQANILKINLFSMLNQSTCSSQIVRKQIIQKFCTLAILNVSESQQSEVEQFKQQEQKLQFNPRKYENMINLYTKTNFFHEILNKLLRSSLSPYQLFYAQPYVHDLYQSIFSIYKYQSALKDDYPREFICYRGCSMHVNEIEKFENNVGSYVECLGFLSASLSLNKAQQFVTNALIIIQVYDTPRLQDFDFGYIYASYMSILQHERQIIFNIQNSFKVEQVYFVQQTKVHIITLSFGKAAQMIAAITNLTKKQQIMQQFGYSYDHIFQQLKFQYGYSDVLWQGKIQIAVGIRSEATVLYFQFLHKFVTAYFETHPQHDDEGVKYRLIEEIKRNVEACTPSIINKNQPLIQHNNNEINQLKQKCEQFENTESEDKIIQVFWQKNQYRKSYKSDIFIDKFYQLLKENHVSFLKQLINVITIYIKAKKFIDCKAFIQKIIKMYKQQVYNLNLNSNQQLQWMNQIICCFSFLNYIIGNISYQEAWKQIIKQILQIDFDKLYTINQNQLQQYKQAKEREWQKICYNKVVKDFIVNKNKLPKNKSTLLSLIQIGNQKYFQLNDFDKCRLLSSNVPSISKIIKDKVQELTKQLINMFNSLYEKVAIKYKQQLQQKLQNLGSVWNYLFSNINNETMKQICFALEVKQRYRKLQQQFWSQWLQTFLRQLLQKRGELPIQQNTKIEQNTAIQNIRKLTDQKQKRNQASQKQ